jgi:NADH:ubiquinone oxidoreductase subunit 5 (subunit L)/multisubunit Na+/H+ antiporter MnhA subunit
MTPEAYQATGETLRNLLMIAWLAPLAGFLIEVLAGYWQENRRSKAAAYLAVGCIAAGFVCSVAAFVKHRSYTHDAEVAAKSHGEAHAKPQAGEEHDEAVFQPKPFSGTIYVLAHFGDLKISVDYYIDTLTLVMFLMVTLIATCIHVFAIGYMSDELTDDHVDHQVHVAGGKHLHRPGRFHIFFSYMSLFSFSMLGLVLAGNIFQVFIFWELVGICSYLLIGFYVERRSACVAANKAFIVNRVGDFGFIIGLMVLWTSCGTFSFGDWQQVGDESGQPRPGLFEMVRGTDGKMNVVETEGGDRVVRLNAGAAEHLPEFGSDPDAAEPIAAAKPSKTMPYWLLIVAGVGIFAGCIGKSAQFPLQTWLPDAMEGPTPVSALVHSATMVAAGVYLAGRFFPVFTPEVLLVIAYVGCITLFLAATIAVVATDIKRVLAYSTISQLGYMMLAIGVAGWGAGLFHLITHAFFKSLLFLCSGSVIVGCHHEQEMTRMGGLWRKMPITAMTMLVGVIAISGLAIPGTPIAFSGFHSKDAIVATALAYTGKNSVHFLLFWTPLVTAGITAFYMFRLWFYTFAGTPRDEELHSHVKESPAVMTVPLLVLALFAAGCAIGGEGGPLYRWLLESEPAGLANGFAATAASAIALPGHADVHLIHGKAGAAALLLAFAGTLIAYLLYGMGLVNPAEIKRQFSAVHRFLVEKWQFDTLYDAMFVRPVHVVASWCAWIDKAVFDGILHGSCRAAIDVSRWDRKFDEGVVDGLVNLVGNVTFSIGRTLRGVQTGKLRQYVMFIALGVLTLFLLLFAFFPQG